MKHKSNILERLAIKLLVLYYGNVVLHQLEKDLNVEYPDENPTFKKTMKLAIAFLGICIFIIYILYVCMQLNIFL